MQGCGYTVGYVQRPVSHYPVALGLARLRVEGTRKA